MTKIFISQPMTGLTQDEIMETRNKAIDKITKIKSEEYPKDDYMFLDNIDFSPLDWDKLHPDLERLSKDIAILSDADEMWLIGGWTNSRGCYCEMVCAIKYRIPIRTLIL